MLVDWVDCFGLFLGRMETYFWKNHKIYVSKSCDGGCRNWLCVVGYLVRILSIALEFLFGDCGHVISFVAIYVGILSLYLYSGFSGNDVFIGFHSRVWRVRLVILRGGCIKRLFLD